MSVLMHACQTGNLEVAVKLASYDNCEVDATDAVTM